MKVVFVDALTNHGGQEKYIINLLSDLSYKFDKNSYLITSNDHTYKDLVNKNLDASRLIKINKFSVFNFRIYFLFFIALKKINPDFIITNGEKSIFIGKVLLHIFRVKYKFIAVHHLLIQDSTRNIFLFKRLFYLFIARNFNSKFFKIVFINDCMKKHLLCYNIPKSLIEFKNNGTNLLLPTISRQLILSKHNIPSQKKIFGYIGQFNKQKNLELIFYALNFYKYNSNIFFVLIGAGEEKLLFKQKVLDQSLKNVLIIDFQEDIHNYFQIFDCLIFPSHYEGLPLTLLEAISHKVPTITSDIDGHRVVLSDSLSTISINPNKLDSVVEAIQVLLNNESVVDQYVKNAYNRYLEHFNWIDVLNFYDNLLSNK